MGQNPNFQCNYLEIGPLGVVKVKRSHKGACSSNPIGLVSLEEETDSPGKHKHREKGKVRTQQEGSHLQAREKPQEKPTLPAH